MAGGHRVLITGLAGYWGTELAKRLQRDPSVAWLGGVDTEPPATDLEHTEFIAVDAGSSELTRLMPRLEVDTVVHIGTGVDAAAQLLAACAGTPTLERLVLRGSAAIYGAEPGAPSFLTEEMSAQSPRETRLQRDLAELEERVAAFAERVPEVVCCMLRYQPEIGAGLQTPLVRYLSLPIVPTQLGFDPRLQLIHADDATGALLAAVRSPVRGAVNVAPRGTISLTKLLRLSGRPAIPVAHPLFGPAFAGLGKQIGLSDLDSDDVLLLRHGRGLDNTRLVEEVGYEPRYDAVDAAREFIGSSADRRLLSLPGLADPRKLRVPV